MSSGLVPVNYYDERIREIIRGTVAKGLNPLQFEVFMNVCISTGLNPFFKEIYAWVDNKGKLVIQTGIDGYRKMAEESGKYRGQRGPFWCGPDCKWLDVWIDSKVPPFAAMVEVIRSDFDVPIRGVARWSSYHGSSPIWVSSPDGQLAKCAEALAIRRAFPGMMRGVYAQEEIASPMDTEVSEVEE